MKFISLVSIFFLALCAQAFDGPGAYERMAYWYAYRMDKLLNGASANTIGPGAPNGKKDTPCTFAQFIDYIDAGKVDPALLKQLPTDTNPDVDKTAATLKKLGITGPYNFGHIYDGATTADDLFTKVTDFVKYKGQKALGKAKAGSPDASLGDLNKQCWERVTKLRKEASSKAIIADLKDKQKGLGLTDDQIATKDVDFYEGSNDKLTYFQPGETIARNPKNKAKIIEIYKGTFDTQHKANIEAAQEAVDSFCKA